MTKITMPWIIDRKPLDGQEVLSYWKIKRVTDGFLIHSLHHGFYDAGRNRYYSSWNSQFGGAGDFYSGIGNLVGWTPIEWIIDK